MSNESNMIEAMIRGKQEREQERRKQQNETLSLEMFEVRKEYTDTIGQERFLYPDLVIHQQITIIIGQPGSAKSAFFLREVFPAICNAGYSGWFLDADSAVNDHPWIREHAERYGFKFLNAYANEGTSPAKMIELLQQLIAKGYSFNNHVLVFDTLKKFSDMMNKKRMKDFFDLQRQLVANGATVVALGHANKKTTVDGRLIYEGTNEVETEPDNLLYFYKTVGENDTLNITVKSGPDYGAKVRGVFNAFSFNVDRDRNITMLNKPINVTTSAANVSNDDVGKALTAILVEQNGKPITKTELVNQAMLRTNGGRDRIANYLKINSAPKGVTLFGYKCYVYEQGEKNAQHYFLNQDSLHQNSKKSRGRSSDFRDLNSKSH